MKLLTELKVKLGYNENDIYKSIEKKYGLKREEIKSFLIIRESLDARKKPNIIISLNIAVETSKSSLVKLKKCSDIIPLVDGLKYEKINTVSLKRPIVVGFGPAGMFAGLVLALSGLNPIILEQGKSVDERQKDVDEFWKNRKLNKYSNIQFGEGGAGTFSDGKLASNVSNEYTKRCINEFILNGAPKEIFYSYTPHIGSDKLKEVVKNIRQKIISHGGEILFNMHFDNFEVENESVKKVHVTNVLTGEMFSYETDSLILAVGHSAIDVYKMLKNKNCEMNQKPFAMGVRIEGLQKDINIAQYGYDEDGLPSANYKLVEHLENGRSVFSFCMCPGGFVVASSSEEETVVINGMSYHARNGKNANAALLVNVNPQDFGCNDVLAGCEFQRKYEKLAFELGGRNYDAPSEKVGTFLKDEDVDSKIGKVKPTYLPNIKFAKLKKCLPDFVYESLRLALPRFDKKIKGFADKDNILIGVESRSSAPVQIIRNDEFMTTKIKGLFVCGEGAGYAGGITSSAQDGVKCGEKLIKYLLDNK